MEPVQGTVVKGLQCFSSDWHNRGLVKNGRTMSMVRERHAIRHLSVTDSLRKKSSCQKATTGPQIKRTNLYSLEKLWNGKGKRKRPLISQFFFFFQEQKKKNTLFRLAGGACKTRETRQEPEFFNGRSSPFWDPVFYT